MSGTVSVRRARSRRRGSGPVLPEELVVWEILVRLPAKTLLRCRAVCHSWRRHTSEAGFLLAHHRRQPSLPLVTFRGQLPAGQRPLDFLYRDLPAAARRSLAVADAALDTLDLRRSPSERNPVLRFNDYNYYRGFSVHASCDGLLLLQLSDDNLFYLCNPATRQWTALPDLTGADGVALYPHVSSGEYRVIYWKGRYTEDRKVVYHVLTVGSSAAARRVDASTASAKRFVEAGWFHDSERPGVLLRGCLHWALHCSPEKVLVVFDTVAETFRTMRSPIAADLEMLQLLEMDATLAISWMDKSHTMMKLWALQDYEKGIWSLKRRIILPVGEMWNVVRNCRFYGKVVSKDGDVLLYCPFSFHLFHSDSKGGLMQNFCWRGAFPWPAGHSFRESLVRHDFFERQPGARVRTLPRFFRGL